jgi:WD40 repeat protein
VSPLPIETREDLPPDNKSRHRSTDRLRLAAAAVFLLFACLAASEATGVTQIASYVATVLRIAVRDGTLVVEVDDPGVRVEVDGKAIAIRGAGLEEIRLNPGSYKVEAIRDGVPVLRELVTVERGGKRVVHVGLEGPRVMASAVDPARLAASSKSASGLSTRKVKPAPRVAIRGQGSECSTVAFSPGGSKLAAAYANGTVILWDPTDGRAERVLEGPLQFVSSVAFSPDGRTLAAGTGYWTRREIDGLIDLWDVATGKRRARCGGHKGPVYCVAFAPDGQVVASGGVDGIPRIWNAERGEPLPPLSKQADWIFAIAYAPDGKTVAIGNDMMARLVDPSTGRQKASLEGHRGQIEAMAFSPDGRTIATGGRDRLIKLWDMATFGLRATFVGHAGWITSLAFGPDGATLAAVGLDGEHSKELKLWDTASGRALATLPGADSHSVAYSPDGRTIATGDLSGAVQILSVAELLDAGASR